MCLYFQVDYSIDRRDDIDKYINKFRYKEINCTGGQCTCEDRDLRDSGVINTTRKGGIKLCNLVHFEDLGIELVFLEGAIEAAESYPIPCDLYAVPSDGECPPSMDRNNRSPSKKLKK